jgi:hypothetical protein
MHVLSFPIHYIKSRRAYRKQKRTALHMLAVSGVVRPGHVELRYAAPIASITAFRAQPTAIKHPETQPIQSQPEKGTLTVTVKQTQQWARNFTSAIVQIANKPVILPWTKQLDV